MAEKTIRLVFDAHAITTERSGIGNYSYRLINALLERESDRTSISLFVNGKIRQVHDTAEVTELTRNIRQGALYNPKHQLVLPGLLDRNTHDLFHSPDFSIPFFRRGVPLVSTIHDIVPLVYPEHLGRSKKTRLLPLYRFLVRYALRVSAAVIVVSTFTKNELVARIGADENKCHVVHLAPTLEPGSAPLPERVSGFSGSRPYLLYVGRHEPYKGLPLLLEAFKSVVARHGIPDVSLVVAGAVDPRYELDVLASRLGLDDKVLFTGYLGEHDLSAVYRHALALVMPSLYEGFGLPPLDAMNHGTPVLCSDRASLPEIAGDAVQYFDPEDRSEFPGVLSSLVNNDTLRRELIIKGKQQAGRFTWAATAAKTVDVYEHALRRRGL